MQKPVLCIIPGWGGSTETWNTFITASQPYFDVRCIELPGFGGVTLPHQVWGVLEYGEYVFQQLLEVRREHPQQKIILLGHSFGGQVAAYVVGTHPESCDELVLIAPAIVRPRRRLKRLVFGGLSTVVKKILKHTHNNTRASEIKQKIYQAFFSPDYEHTSGIKREIFKKVIREDMRYILPRIDTHVLLFWGARDSYTPIRHGRKIGKLLRNVETIVFPYGTHGLHHTHTHDILTKLKERYT